MAFQKMGNFTFKHIDQTDELGLTADEAKEKFDSRGEELKTALNNAVDALNATADGNSGADNVGATAVEGWPGSSVQAILESAKSDIAGHKAAAAVQAHLAKNIAIEDTEGLFTATHVEGALGELFTSVSNGKDAVAAAITDKGVPTSGSDSFSQMADNIDSIVLGSGNAVEADVLSGKTFSNDSGTGKVGTMPNRGAVSQSLAVNGTYTIPQGYHNGAGQVTQAIPTKGAATITPSTVNQVIAAGQYLSGAQTIAGSANLLAANIKEGVNIFGVVGNLKPSAFSVSFNKKDDIGTVSSTYIDLTSNIDSSKTFSVFSYYCTGSDTDLSRGRLASVVSDTRIDFHRGNNPYGNIFYNITLINSDSILVKRGTATILSNSGTSTYASIAPITNINKAFLIFDWIGTTNQTGNAFIQGEITSSSQITFTRGIAYGGATIYWQVVEFL